MTHHKHSNILHIYSKTQGHIRGLLLGNFQKYFLQIMKYQGIYIETINHPLPPFVRKTLYIVILLTEMPILSTLNQYSILYLHVQDYSQSPSNLL